MTPLAYLDLLNQQRQSGKRYLEFLNSGALSMGLYVLPAGSTDTQQPHTEDEVYYVTEGRGRFVQSGEDSPVGPGDIIYVPANVDHRFHSIIEDLKVLVFFAPAEYTNRPR